MPDEVQDEIDSTDDGDSHTVAWFLTGALIGAAVAVLYAPKSGRDTRQFISTKTTKGRDAITDTSKDIVGASKEMFERGRKLVEDAAALFERGRRLVKG